jgi:hypothetical protein
LISHDDLESSFGYGIVASNWKTQCQLGWCSLVISFARFQPHRTQQYNLCNFAQFHQNQSNTPANYISVT